MLKPTVNQSSQSTSSRQLHRFPLEHQFITPQIALALLANSGQQRALLQGRVDKYAREMLDGAWTHSFDPIVIDVHGHTANGQHRLSAIVKAGKSGFPGLSMLVAKGVSDEIIRKMDIGKSRELGDRMAMLGDLEKREAKRIVAVATAMRNGMIKHWPYDTDQERWDFPLRYKDTIRWADKHFAGHQRGVGRAAVVAGFARAAHCANSNEQLNQLARAAEILITGLCNTEVAGESTMIRLRDALRFTPRVGVGSNNVIFRLTIRSLRAFLDGEDLKIIKQAKVNYFPLPEDSDLKANEDLQDDVEAS